jgi:ABC-type transporter Mla maintaining outer membrane lipid asymmetry permease subunit MlaE
MHSPFGVAIIAVLNIISGIILLITGLGLIALGTIVPGMPPPSAFEQSQNMTDPADIDLSDVSPSVFEAVVVAIGGIITAVGVVSFIVAYGLLKGMGWAWTLTVVLSIISILLNAISLATGKFKWNSLHYNKRNNPLLHLQITCQVIFWKRFESCTFSNHLGTPYLL